ncbi:U3 small nucleolar RNA-associated protein 6-domain-containing protein [Xylariales sp. AK1849]|nr:U3 small nucleolar RNA-associated protein 6-domain-containing protein [Xylariales sp. AK1849]
MAGVPEKARYYLEQSVPQLREFESLSIFSPSEISSLVKKRSDFEHLVLAPGSKPTDWLSYAQWEKGLESLRARRCKRLQIKKSSSHVGQGRVFGILERAVGRHPGSLEIWSVYLEYARDTKATKRWRKVMSRALRMHPAKPDLWILAGRRSASHGDMQAARGFFMRGARFCTRDTMVWLAYAKCEMEWLERMEARKVKKGGVRKALQEQAEHGDGEILFAEEGDSEDDVDEEGRLVLPNPDAGTGTTKVFTDAAVETLEKKNPALDGAIPLAIFDIATKQPFFTAGVAEQFFDVFAQFPNVSSQGKIIQKVVDTTTEVYPNAPATCSCFIRQPLVGLDFNSAAYPKALREALAHLKVALGTTTNKEQLAQKIIAWIEPALSSENLDTGIRAVLEYTVRTLPKP